MSRNASLATPHNTITSATVIAVISTQAGHVAPLPLQTEQQTVQPGHGMPPWFSGQAATG